MASGSSSSGTPQMAKKVVFSPLERNGLASLDQKLAMAKRCSHVFGRVHPLDGSDEGSDGDHPYLEGVVAGAKAAVLATVASAIPTLASVRMLPWARTYLNPTAQALIISSAAGAAYFIVADKTVLASARKNSFEQAHQR